MDYIITKDELTSLADAIRRFDGTSGTLSYPNGFESAFDAALPWAFDGQDYDIVGGEGKIGEDTSSIKTMVIDWSSEITTRKYFQNANLKMASFPNAISLNSSTFVRCYQLESVSAPKVTIVGTSFIAFASKLSFISLPECITIETKAFGAATGLEDIYMPKCTTIKSGAFLECPNLSNISGPEVITIENYLFAEPSSASSAVGYGPYVAKDISLPKCNNVSYYALSNINGIGVQGGYINNLLIGVENLSFPLYSVKNAIFPSCTSITTKQTGRDDLISVNFSILSKFTDSCFSGCDSLVTIIAPLCEEIGETAFARCTSLKNIDFSACKKIGPSAFSGCTSLSTINLPACSEVGNRAFQSIGNIQASNINLENCKIFGQQVFSSTSIIGSLNIPNCINIDSYAFYGLQSLYSINIYSNIEDSQNTVTIGIAAFATCTALNSIPSFNITNGSIPGSCFQSCASLSTINIPNCTYIGDRAFYGCTILSDINLPLCEVIGSRGFMMSTATLYDKLKEINMPKCINIGDYAFAHRGSLNSIIYSSNTVTSFGTGVFLDTAFGTFSDSAIISIGSSCFASVNMLTFSFPNCTTIFPCAFQNNTNLRLFDLPACESIYTSAFANNTKLSIVTLGNNLNNIADLAFVGCTSLASLTILNSISVPVLANANAFSGTALSGTGSGYIYVPENMVNAYKAATNWKAYSSHIKAIGT